MKSRVELWPLFGFFNEEQRETGIGGQMDGWVGWVGWTGSHGLRRSDDVHGCVVCSE